MVENIQPLSEREQEILHLVATGATNQQVAVQLSISVNTVKVHLRNIFSKLSVESRTEATMWAVQQGLITIPGTKPVEDATEDADTDLPSQELQIEPISRTKRIVFIAAALVIAVLAFGPPLLRISARNDVASASAFSDQAGSQVNRNLFSTSRWSARAQMLAPRARLAVTSFDGMVYVIGGDAGTSVSDMVEAYDPARNAWRIGTSKPTAVSNVEAVTIDNLIYVPGGTLANGQVTDVLEVYDPIEDTWFVRESLPAPICAYAIASLGTDLYLFGGWDGESYLNVVYRYDTLADRWSDGSPMSVARGFAGAGTIENKIYVVGGYNEEQEFALCAEYDPALEGTGESPWRDRASMSLPRGGVAVSTTGDNLFAIGGGWQNYLAYNERYDPRNNTWFSFESPIVGQWRNLGVATVDVSLYAIGGYSGEYLSTNEEYQALYRIILPLRP